MFVYIHLIIEKRLIVKNFGPIKYIDFNLKKINVFIGPQGSGKSTLAKIISFCSWLDKRRGDDGVYADAYKHLMSYHIVESLIVIPDSLYRCICQ